LLTVLVIAYSNLLSIAIREVYAETDIHVKIVTSPNSSYQLQTAARINEHLADINIGSSIISPEKITRSAIEQDSFYIAIGQTAIDTFISRNIEAPLLRISNTAITDEKYNSGLAHLVLEQQQCREIELIKAISKNWKSIGVLSSISSVDKVTELTKCAIKYNFNLLIYSIDTKEELAVTFEKAVRDSDTILALADPLIYNRQTVKNILLTSYRSRRPIIGYSESFIDAGAIAGIFTSPESVGDSVSMIISDYLQNGRKFRKAIYHPMTFTVKTNRQVARSLEIDLPEDTDIHDEILRMEEQ